MLKSFLYDNLICKEGFEDSLGYFERTVITLIIADLQQSKMTAGENDK